MTKTANCPCGDEPVMTIRGKKITVMCESCGEFAATGNEPAEAIKVWNSMVAQQEYRSSLKLRNNPYLKTK